MRSSSVTPKRTDRVKQLEQSQRGYRPLNMASTSTQSLGAAAPATQSHESESRATGAKREHSPSARRTDPQVTFVNSARAASAKMSNELRGLDDVMVIHSDHNSDEDEEELLLSGRVETTAKRGSTSSNSPSNGSAQSFGGRKPADTTPIPTISGSPAVRRTEPSESIAKKMEGFGQPYAGPRLSSLSNPKPRDLLSPENLFQSVAKLPASSSKVVDRMRPKGSSGWTAKPDGSSLTDAKPLAATTGKDTLFSSKTNADEIIDMMRSSPKRQAVAAPRKQSADRGRGKRASAAPRRRDSNASRQLNQHTPPKKLPLSGVRIGKYVQLADACANNSSAVELQVCIRFVQKVIEINGLCDGTERMKILLPDIAGIEHRTRDALVVLRIIPTTSVESIFGAGIFDPESEDASFKDIFMCFQLTGRGDDTALSRLVSTFKEDVIVETLDLDMHRKYAQELSKPSSTEVVLSSDEEDRANADQKRGMSMSAASNTPITKATAATSGYWGSIDTHTGTHNSARRGLGISGDGLTWQDPALYGKRKTQSTLFGAGAGSDQGMSLPRYKLRKTKAGESQGAPSPIAFNDDDDFDDDDDDDFVSQCREFRLDDHTLRFSYPRDGIKPISVTGSDICRLYKGEFLNDTILEFYVRYIDENLRSSNPSLHEQCFFFNTFFFKKLSHRNKAAPYDPDSNPMDAVHRQLQKWTSSVELFDKQYIFVPINENTHWYLAIIANSKSLLAEAKNAALATPKSEPPPTTDAQKFDGDAEMKDVADAEQAADSSTIDSSGLTVDPEKPVDGTADSGDVDITSVSEPASPLKAASARSKAAMVSIEGMGKTFEVPEAKYLDPTSKPAIIILDSLGNRHQPTYGLLRGYMRAEAKSRHGVDLVDAAQVGKYAKVPLQNNFCDCGVYLLHYIEEFLKGPAAFLALALNGISMRDMFTSSLMQQKRLDILGLATSLAEEHKRLGTAQSGEVQSGEVKSDAMQLATDSEDKTGTDDNDNDKPTELPGSSDSQTATPAQNDNAEASDTQSDASRIATMMSEVLGSPKLPTLADLSAPPTE
ncbi:hypothetical protein GGF43_002200 [Coemansia sp. RSA 2618]|nr:hypothetical protein GGF43_002200 [Coemansia sp. RSA 2618]